ncbi:MAG: terpene cyclase/mutase family protein [Planctomycetota bacterium]|nr:terpene cyclase/mutase family protein [Planctomycetota bacterium]MDI6788294.1 terpene cyclase/mutase family protein [Planctomycetota bacterium]
MITRKITLYILCAGLFCLTAYSQPASKEDTKKKVSAELQDKINNAITLGTEYLSTYITLTILPAMPVKDHEGIKHTMRFADLILYTLGHCGVGMNENWDDFIKRVTELPLDKVYHVSLQAMALEHIDRFTYQQRIADCAEYLIENQCKNGQWSYGSEKPSPRWERTGRKGKVVITGDGRKSETSKAKPSSSSTQAIKLEPIRINAKPQGPPTGDNSNTQYAVLGLRACIEAKVYPQDEVLQSAKKWFLNSQDKDGSWGYSARGVVPSPGYGSMTMGAIGSLIILKHYLKEPHPGNKDVWFNNAMKWIIENFTVTKNPGTSPVWHYYYLYAMERFGMLSDKEKFGNQDWYLEGAKFLVEKQDDNGSWNGNIYDTCFALLFLMRATKPFKIVTTGG